MARAIRDGKEYNEKDIIIECADGRRRFVLAHANPISDECGRIAGAVNVLVDVTDRKLVGMAHAEYAAIVESSNDAIIAKNLEGIITSWNPDAERLYGYTKDEVIGKPISILVPPHFPNELPTILNRLKNGERIEHFETIRLRKDGVPVHVSLTISPIRDEEGKLVGASKIARDISERKRLDDALDEQSERQRLLSEAASILVKANDPDTMVRELFRKIGTHFGLDSYFNYVVNDSRDGLLLASFAGISNDLARSISTLEFGEGICGKAAVQRQPVAIGNIHRSSDPDIRWLKSVGLRACVCHPLVSGAGLIGTLSFGSRTKDQFASDEIMFLDIVTRQLAVAYERLRLLKQLKEADRRKDEFLATLAHELRNPLAPLRNGLQIMRLAGENSDASLEARTMMERQLGQMVRLIDDLLDLSRITNGKIAMRKERIDLATVVRDALETCRPLLEAAGHEVSVSLPPRPVVVYVDRIRLAQVFANLLNNSAKYTERGGRIWLTVERQGSDVVVRVKDTGVGIPPEMLPKVFDIFSQVDQSLDRSQGGLGIGLNLVRRLVEMHGGCVEAYSDGHGKGSEFIVRLSVHLGAGDEPPREEADVECGQSQRILVVDDNRDSASSLATLLQIVEHETQTAHDGLEAVEGARSFRPHVVLLDIGLPKLNGYDACRSIRAQPWGRDIVLVALTGWGQEEDKQRSKEAGFDFHLTKPVKLADIEKLLAGLC